MIENLADDDGDVAALALEIERLRGVDEILERALGDAIAEDLAQDALAAAGFAARIKKAEHEAAGDRGEAGEGREEMAEDSEDRGHRDHFHESAERDDVLERRPRDVDRRPCDRDREDGGERILEGHVARAGHAQFQELRERKIELREGTRGDQHRDDAADEKADDEGCPEIAHGFGRACKHGNPRGCNLVEISDFRFQIGPANACLRAATTAPFDLRSERIYRKSAAQASEP